MRAKRLVGLFFILSYLFGSLVQAETKVNVPPPALTKSAIEEDYEGLKLSGTPDFRSDVKQALGLLKANDNEGYQLVMSGKVNTIGMGAITEMWIPATKQHSGLMEVKASTDSHPYSMQWLAASLVHEACHANQRRYGSQTHLELECNARQLETLKKLNASDEEIAFLEKADGKHWDKDGDGVFTAKDRLAGLPDSPTKTKKKKKFIED